MTVQIQDAGGNPTNVAAAYTVNLATTSNKGVFLNGAGASSPASSSPPD